jgi:hypothetical protein
MLLSAVSVQIIKIFKILNEYLSLRGSGFFGGFDNTNLYRYVELTRFSMSSASETVSIENCPNNRLPDDIVPIEWLINRLEHLYLQIASKYRSRDSVENDAWCYATLNSCGVEIERLGYIYLDIWTRIKKWRSNNSLVKDVNSWESNEGYSHLIRLLVLLFDLWCKNDIKKQRKKEMASRGLEMFLNEVSEIKKKQSLDLGQISEEGFIRICNWYNS